MSTRSEQLRNELEDAAFAVLMDRIAEQEGARLIEENERLKNDPDAAVPEEIDKACLETIRRGTAKKRRKTAHISVWTVLQRVAVVALIIIALFMVVYAAFPDVRVDTLNLLIQTSKIRSQLNLSDSDENDTTLSEQGSIMVMGYLLPPLSDKFSETARSVDDLGEWVEFSHKQGATVMVMISKLQTDFIDTEGAETAETISIHGYTGFLMEKNNSVTISWVDTDNSCYIDLTCIDLNRAFAIYFAEGITFVGS